jgi:hypothetical protein
MPGKQYTYHKESLEFIPEKPGLKQRLWSAAMFLASSLAFTAIVIFCIFVFTGSPKMEQLEQENAALLSKYRELEHDFHRIDSFLNETRITDDSIYRVIVQAPPLDAMIREGGFGGTDRYHRFENLRHAGLVISTTKQLDKLTGKATIQLHSYDEVLLKACEKEQMLASLPAISPIPEHEIGYISDYFGYRIHPIYKKRIYHWGVDLTANIGTEIYAPGNGVVEEIDYASPGYGRMMVINHGFGFKTRYGHISKFNVAVGDTLKRGDTIAFVGNTGTSSGPHLHYEIIKDNQRINPFIYFTLDMDPSEYLQIVKH